MNDVKKKIYLIVGITLILLGLSSTFAWVIWYGEEETEVNFSVNGIDVTSTNVDISGTIYPTNDKNKGIVKEFTMVQNNELNSPVCADFTLTLTTLPTGLIHESFSYEVYRGDTLTGKGNFGSSAQGDVITIATGQPVTSSVTTFTIYIWIDGVNYENPMAMFGQSFLFTLGISVNQQTSACNPSVGGLVATSEECFTFDSSKGSITDYLCVSGNSNGLPTITDVVIPESINGVTVTTIGSSAFTGNNLTSVVFPNTITSIATGAFRANNIASLVIPDSVQTIDANVFNFNNLTSIYIGKNSNLNSIGQYTFLSSSLSNKNLTTIYNNSGKSFDWSYAITGTAGTPFATGNTTIKNGNGVLIDIITGGNP